MGAKVSRHEAFMAQFRLEQRSVNRLAIVAATALSFLAVVGMLAWLVAQSISSITSTANNLDDSRAEVATKGALHAQQKQISATVRDNTYWDDAFEKVNSEEAVEWIFDNWGSTTADYPLYDTMVVVDGQSKPVVAYHNGELFTDKVMGFYDPSFGALLTAAHKPDPNRVVPSGFIRTKQGIALVAGAAIQPYVMDPKADYADYKVLVFSKQITPEVLKELGETFNIHGLTMSDSKQPGMLHAPLKNILGEEIAYFNWPSEKPGNRSYVEVEDEIISAGVIFVLLIAAICAVGFGAVRSVRKEERMSAYKATHDALTGLWNRAGLLERIDHALKGTAPSQQVQLYLLDLDGFKAVNDAWGHAIGDKLIRSVATRLVEALPTDSIVARLGGDEFAILATAAPLESGSEHFGDRIQDVFRRPFALDGRTVEIGGSVGLAASMPGELDTHELLRRSDMALYRAKDLGKGITVLFDPSFDADAVEEAEVEQELRRSLAQKEIDLAFQPLIDARTGAICGVEALVRWTSPSRGRMNPEIFIGIAERSGLIDQLGQQVFEKAIGEAASWPGIGLAINVSPIQLKNPYFAKEVTDTLARFDFDPQRLTIEVTEGVLISNPEQAKRAFTALKKLGVKIALDDFGCGYASIGALRTFGFDRMKIDRSLVAAIDADARGGAVLQATIALANALEVPVTAEGIETESQATAVKLSGCDELQGYLFSRPIPADELTSRYFSSKAAPEKIRA
jgi:diguanylate cyclase (GGDEF)-like protein